MRRRSLGALAAAVALTIPWLTVWGATTALPEILAFLDLGTAYEPPAAFTGFSSVTTVAVSGLAVLGSAFLLAWGAETAEKDVPRAFAIAVLAVLAVAPEYAVDALYAWNAGVYAGTERGIEAGNLAVANMTGANRILIGIGWAGIVLFTVYRSGASADPAVEKRSGLWTDGVSIDHDISLEVVFLLLATAWAFLVPLNGGIDILDMIVLVGLYLAYIVIILRGDVDPGEEHVGVPAYLQKLPKPRRITTVILLFAYSGGMIFTAVEPFAHGLEEIGVENGIPEFFMIQWVAPLASEAPELIVVLYLVNKARSTAGFNALISSKLNQWTLLIGTLVVMFSLGQGAYGPLSFDQKQSAEIWLTAAQSFFAIAILLDFEISVREAIALLVLFTSQVLIEFLIIRDIVFLPLSSYDFLLLFSAVYVVLGLALFAARRRECRRLLSRTAGTIRTAVSDEETRPQQGD